MNKKRIQQLQTQLQQSGYDVAAIQPGPNLLYLTGIHSHLSERPLVLFVPAEGELAIVIPILEAPKAEKAGIAPTQIFGWGDGEGYAGAFQRASHALGLDGQTAAVETLYMRVLELEMLHAVAPQLKTAHVDGLMNGLRLVKDDEELGKMERAVAVAETAMAALLPQIKIGQTEKYIAGLLAQELLNAGSEAMPFSPIVSSGPNAASPHAVPTDRPIGAGELLIIDWGAVVADYPSDLTRTFAVGDISAELRHLYEAVASANEAGKAASAPGATCSAVDEAARGVITAAGYGDYFIHRTGHGLGLEVHEAPSMMTGNLQKLVTGMVFTVEPGIYLPGVGGARVEDDVVITADGHRSLSTFPRTLLVVG
jgi:Xaa-Pro dipeptidase